MSAKSEVSKGAKMLDEKMPGWHKKIDPANLHMSSDTWCIMGQLSKGVPEIGLKKLGILYEDAEDYGFVVNHGDEEYKGLWINQIKKRLALDAKPKAIPAEKEQSPKKKTKTKKAK